MSADPINPFKPVFSSAPGQQMRAPNPELIAELLHAQKQVSQQTQELNELRARLSRRTHQMTMLQHVAEILAATPKISKVADVMQEVFTQEYMAKACVVWILAEEGGSFIPRASHGVPRQLWPQLHLPAPNPFPDSPLLLFQPQWLEEAITQGPLINLQPPGGTALYFIPFEQQLLLMGFVIMAIDSDRKLDDDQESLGILQRQVAVSIYNAWLFRDLGEQRDTLKRQAMELETANAALKEADRFKSEFLALTSHELRTPLTGILGFTRLVIDGLYEDENEARQMLQDSYASGKHLLALLNDILDLAKIEAGRMQINKTPFNLQAVIEEVKPIASAYPRTEGVSLVWPENLETLPPVLIDPGRLKQVLLNLLSNALKFTKEGSVIVSAERGFGAIAIRVQDTGIGVKPEDQARLFQKFVQAEGGHSREYGGTGLGLVICKHLMSMMNGSISLYSEGQGMGSTLTLTVPVA